MSNMHSEDQEDYPNILWICTDQQRWDTIHSLGNKEIDTPNIDFLVEQGVSFNQAYTQCPICTPSRATFLTGRYPASHHVHRNGADYFPSYEKLVTKILSENGYHGGLIGKLHLSRAQGRIEVRPDDGYDEFFWSQHPYPDWPEGNQYTEWLEHEMGVDPHELYSKLTTACGPGVPTELHQTTWCGSMAIDFIRRSKNDKWFLSVNFFDPHPPFDPPKEYFDKYLERIKKIPKVSTEDIERQKAFIDIDQQSKFAFDHNSYLEEPALFEETLDTKHLHDRPPEKYDIREVVAGYYAMVELIDVQVGRMIEELKATGQLENTIIIFMSDHGELLGDNGLIYKGCRFFDALVRVPLIMYYPNLFKRGKNTDALVELVDVPVTILDLLNIEIPENMQGRSIKSLLTESINVHKQVVVSEFNDALGFEGAEHTHGTMSYDGEYKLCLYHGHDVIELFNLKKDPFEKNNLWDDDSIDAKTKTSLLKQHIDAIMKTSDAGIQRTADF